MAKKKATSKKDEPIINKEAAKAKAEEVYNNVKEGATEIANNVKEGVNEFSDNFKEVSGEIVHRVKGDKSLIIACCVCAFVVFVIFIAILSAIFSDGSKSAVKDFSKAVVKLDARKYCKAINSDIIEEEYGEFEECVDVTEKEFDAIDKDRKFKDFEIKSKKKLDKEDVEELAENLEDKFDIDQNKVKKVVRYKIKYNARGTSRDKNLYVFVAKVKNHWRVVAVDDDKEVNRIIGSVELYKIFGTMIKNRMS